MVGNNTILYPSVCRCCFIVSMAVVIRLQGLSVTAGTEDIRKFFMGLKIPDGGVHIIGGELDEAFIIFASDEDARRAMTRSGKLINGSAIKLLLSSKAEMQVILERSTKTVEPEPRRQYEDNERRGERSLGRGEGKAGQMFPPKHQRAPNGRKDDMCLFLKGLPFSVTEKEIHDFFGGLLIDEVVLLKNEKGFNNGRGLVKFATSEDAMEGLKRDKEYIGSRYIELSPTSMDNWFRLCGRFPMDVNASSGFERDRSPIRTWNVPQSHARSRSPPNQSLIAPGDEYCVLIDNLSFAVEKEDIKQYFRHTNLEDDQILHLLDERRKRTRSAFVLFKNQRDYCDALAEEKVLFFNRQVHIRPISREKMMALLQSHYIDSQTPGNSQLSQERSSSHSPDSYDSEKLCLFVRNLPFDVRKVEIMDFFHGFNITEDKVYLLLDHNGAGVGKVLVLFRSEAEATRALSLNGQRFLGSEVILKGITQSQMRQLGVDIPMFQEPLSREERYSNRTSVASHRSDDPEYPDIKMSHEGRHCVPSYHSAESEYHDFKMYRDGGASMQSVQNLGNRGWDPEGLKDPWESGNSVHGDFGPPAQPCDGPTCVRLVNLPFQIRSEEIYDFCHGYRVIPGSVSLQFDQGGKPTGTATVVFESRSEAIIAAAELSGRPIGPRKIRLVFI